jgi:hypothetical protein
VYASAAAAVIVCAAPALRWSTDNPPLMNLFLNPKVFTEVTLPVTDNAFAEGVIESIANVPYAIL